ncbi:MAG: hypothetical protein JJ938_15600 [Roseicyclus sp.]|nr:hypothetical protein [Roseicyclus sp.]MBO6626302.1 hypothetical protein [Roseicyclus sp.]MBO6922657.1 hypothetical protein [Roseicyclus sp.]
MKRSLLALTTAIALALPAVAQEADGPTEFVRDVLTQYGYDAAAVETMTAAEITEIYLAATSENSMAVRSALRGMDLPETEPTDYALVTRTSDVERHVAGVLEEHGYMPVLVNTLSDGEIALIYTTATSEEYADVEGVLSAMNLVKGQTTFEIDWEVPTDDNIERVVADRLMQRGFEQAQIDALTEAETAELYLAFTSEDNEAIDSTLDGIFNS